MENKAKDFSYEKSVWMNVEDALDACDSISTEINDLVDNLRDICSKIYGHPNQEMLNAVIKRTSFRLDDALRLKISLFDDFSLVNKVFHWKSS